MLCSTPVTKQYQPFHVILLVFHPCPRWENMPATLSAHRPHYAALRRYNSTLRQHNVSLGRHISPYPSGRGGILRCSPNTLKPLFGDSRRTMIYVYFIGRRCLTAPPEFSWTPASSPMTNRMTIASTTVLWVTLDLSPPLSPRSSSLMHATKKSCFTKYFHWNETHTLYGWK